MRRKSAVDSFQLNLDLDNTRHSEPRVAIVATGEAEHSDGSICMYSALPFVVVVVSITADDHPNLHREVAAAVQSVKKGKSAGVDNIPAELVQAGRGEVKFDQAN